MPFVKEINKLIEKVKAEGITIPEIFIEQKALSLIPTYLSAKRLKRIVLVVDGNTRKAAGEKLRNMLDNDKFCLTIIELKPNKHEQVVADEQTLINLFLEMPNNTDIIAAVGAGTIHDVVRFIGYKMAIPFISVPTAASVDGFTSKGAPLIIRGFKNTFQTASPIAVFADIDVLKEAPHEMTAAGFGDILGKYTSLLDWKISSLIADEPYNQFAADLTRGSLEACVNNVQEIANRSDNGLIILMQSLIETGLVMLVLDFSRPASGSEHHLSHYWEMDLLEKDKKQLLHGAKVGVATSVIIDLYKQFVIDLDVKKIAYDSSDVNSFIESWDQIKAAINEMPNSNYLKSLLETVGGATTPKELNLDDQLVVDSLNEAFHLRNRCTGLFLINQLKKEDIKYPIENIVHKKGRV